MLAGAYEIFIVSCEYLMVHWYEALRSFSWGTKLSSFILHRIQYNPFNMLNKNVTLLPSLVPLCKLLNLAQHPTPRASWMHQGGWWVVLWDMSKTVYQSHWLSFFCQKELLCVCLLASALLDAHRLTRPASPHVLLPLSLHFPKVRWRSKVMWYFEANDYLCSL